MNETPIDPRWLATFVAVVDQNSFSKAALRLGVGKGTISRTIAALERSVGVELIHRTTHRVALSTAGTALYERVAPHLRALDQAMAGLPERSEEPSGLLRVAAPHDFGTTVLPRILAAFALRHPEVTFDVRIASGVQDIVRDGIDVAIRVVALPLRDSSVRMRRLGLPRLAFYAAPRYLARRGIPRTWGAEGHEGVVHEVFVTSWKATAFPVRCVTDDFLLARDLLRNGAGIGVLPAFIAKPYVGEGLLEELPLEVPSADVETYVLLYPSSGQVPRKVSAFCDAVADWLRREPL